MHVPASHLQIKRAYAPPEPGDGTRVLVDRLWPRGVKKADAAVDHWLKEIAPSKALREWFAHDPARWDEFRERYAKELDDRPELLTQLRELARAGTVTLVYAAHDEAHNNAVALRERLLGR